jgi:hypothetical protein
MKAVRRQSLKVKKSKKNSVMKHSKKNAKKQKAMKMKTY